MINSFKIFFDRKYFAEDKKYTTWPLSEMAMYNDISKIPTKFDKDDIEFLHQFPKKFWTRAIWMRYNEDLPDALEAREKKRGPGYEKLNSALSQAILSQNWSLLQGLVPEDRIRELSQKYGSEYHKNQLQGNSENKQRIASKAASIEAEYEAERQHPHGDEPGEDDTPAGYRKYTFKERGLGNSETIIAKPFVNRLIHKLERNRGQQHVPGSGLEGQSGLYGYDLHNLKRGNPTYTLDRKAGPERPNATRGMQMPADRAIYDRMTDWLSHNAHQIHGKLPDNVKWKPTQYTDKFAYSRHYTPAVYRWIRQLKTSEPGKIELPDGSLVPPMGGWSRNNEIEKAARQLANKEMIQKAEAGELRGAPIPGVPQFEKGIPITLKTNKDGSITPVNPKLWLPHEEKVVKFADARGNAQERKEWVPIVNPAEFFRALGSEESDYERDDDGKLVLGPDGKAKLAVPEDQLRGYDKSFVHVPHDQYTKKKDYNAGSALHFTQNSGGRQYIDPSDPEYQERYDAIIGNMNKIALSKAGRASQEAGDFYDDIIKGIWQCIDGDCGGGTSHEKEKLQIDLPDIHQIIMQHMLMNLRDPKLDSPAKRRAYAKNIASSYVQQDFGEGGGTRRKRALRQDVRNVSIDQSTSGKDGGEMGVQDAIFAKMAEKERAYAAADSREQGGRFRNTGSRQFAYHLDNLNKELDDLVRQAQQADAASKNAIGISQREIGQHIIDLLANSSREKANVLTQIRILLMDIHKSQGIPEDQADEIVHRRMQEYMQGGADVAAVVQSFAADPLIQQVMQGAQTVVKPGDEAPLTQDEKVGLDRLRDDLEQIRQNGKSLNDPQVRMLLLPQGGQPLSLYVKKLDQYFTPGTVDRVRKRVQDEIFKLYKAEQPKVAPAQAPAADNSAQSIMQRMAARNVKPAGTETPAEKWEDLYDQKRYAELSSHPGFLFNAKITSLQGLLKWFQNNQGKIDPQEYNNATGRLNSVINRRLKMQAPK